MRHLTSSDPLVQYVCHCHLTLEVMAFITCNQLLLFTKQATFTPFAMYGIVSKINIKVLLLQTMLEMGHAVMDDVIYRTKKRALILRTVFCVSGQYIGKLVE